MGCGVSSTTGSAAAQYQGGDDNTPVKPEKAGGDDDQLLELVKELLKANPDLIPSSGMSNIPI